MTEIKYRQPNSSPEIQYGEIHIPDDENLGTGTFATLLKPNVLSSTKVISSIMINRPKFQISVNINPGSRKIPVLLGKADGTDPISSQTFLLPPNADSTKAYKFVVIFENWQIINLEMDGVALAEK